ncbi:MAG TPA: hypothetical protein VFX16_02705 [Pseudonocardiaceae bacterium]|nr:hypothetical protein [Pseudonocardiaceae bacterium]
MTGLARMTVAVLTAIGSILSTPAAAIGLALAAIAAYVLEPDPYTHSWCRRIRRVRTRRWVRSLRRAAKFSCVADTATPHTFEGIPVHSPVMPPAPSSCLNVRRPGYDPRMLGGGAVVPYVGSWTGEELMPTQVVQRPSGGIGYADETLVDRDEWGVLWTRMASRVGIGRPLFTKLHPLRQRRAMRRLLCQVCARPADRTDEGLLWLVPGADRQPEGMATIQPPLCLACARVSVGACPALRTGCVAVRARTRLCGVVGVRFQPGRLLPRLADDDADEVISYDDPVIVWVQATQLARSLHDCTPVDVERL